MALAKTNIGRFFTDGENCLHLQNNEPEHIANRLVELLENPSLAKRIGAGAGALRRSISAGPKRRESCWTFMPGTSSAAARRPEHAAGTRLYSFNYACYIVARQMDGIWVGLN